VHASRHGDAAQRRAILQSFIDRPRIRSTHQFHHQLEQRARDNPARSLSTRRPWFS
jgi:predicted metal-dependent HD superfamily phosphohydrolase